MATYREQPLGFEWIPTSLTTTPWQVMLAKRMFAETADGKLKSFFGAQGWNVDLIDRLNAVYLSPKYKTLSEYDKMGYLVKEGKITNEIAYSFLNHINDPDLKDKKSGGLNNILLVAGLVAVAAIVSNVMPLFRKK